MTSGRGLPSFDLVVPSRTQPEPEALDLLTDRTVARPKPPGARDVPVRTAAPEPPPLFRGGRPPSNASFLSVSVSAETLCGP
ncbi:hypothetical protein GCM10010103_64260 [Streptomyces paradoxus]